VDHFFSGITSVEGSLLSILFQGAVPWESLLWSWRELPLESAALFFQLTCNLSFMEE
jgi:hypothetical protein